jgi:hypothetical protein
MEKGARGDVADCAAKARVVKEALLWFWYSGTIDACYPDRGSGLES